MGEKHKNVLSLFPAVKIIAHIDPKKKLQNPHYISLEEFIEKKLSVDLIIISTPNYLHHENAITLLNNGYNVLIEKPFCFNVNEFNNIQKACLKNNKKAFLVMQNRFSNVSLFLENLIHKKLGQIYNIQCNAFWNRGEKYYAADSWKGKKNTDGGILYTQFFHLIDMIINILNEKLSIKYKDFSSFRNKNICEIEDSVIAVLESEKGTKVILNFTNAVYNTNQETSLNIIAEKGTIKISGQYFDEIVYQNMEGMHEKIILEKKSNEDNLYQLYQEVFKNLNHQENKALLIDEAYHLTELLSNFYQT